MSEKNIDNSNNHKWMNLALEMAKIAEEYGEVPVGAVIVKENKLIASGFNLRERAQDPTKHAEIMAIQNACKALSSWRLNDCNLYVTLEPCLMCAGAIYQARIGKVFIGTKDPKAGAMGSLYSIHSDNRLNHSFEVESGLLEQQCQAILKTFFQKLRDRNKKRKEKKL